MKTKYIIFEDGSGLEYPVIFPEFVQHINIKNKIDQKVISAGFVNFSYDFQTCEMVASCYGSSLSLKVGCGPDDKRLIEKMIFNIGY